MQWTSDELLASLQKRPSPNAYRKFMDDLRGPKYKRSAMLPVALNTETGKREWALPSIFVDMLEAAMLPGDVYQGNVSMYGADGRTNPQVINRSADLAGMMTLGAGAIPADANSLRMGIKAYHGSPHDFDRFDMSKIGTGEGAQAYGHGLYFAENEGVARSYRDNLGGQIPFVDGAPTNDDYVRRAANHIAQMGWTPEQAAADGAKRLQRLKSEYAVGRMKGNEYLKAQIDYLEEFQPTLDALVGKQVEFRPAGRMYEVNIDADPNDFLDWDKPLSEQPQKVRNAVQNVANLNGQSGGYIWDSMVKQKNADGAFGEHMADPSPAIRTGPKAAQEEFRKAGIPGIKYLDAGSRGAVNINDIRGSLSMWENTLKKTPNDLYAQQQVATLRQQLADAEKPLSRNYVVFDDKLISIVKKYGVAALVSAGVLSQVQGDELKAQGYY